MCIKLITINQYLLANNKLQTYSTYTILQQNQ